MLLPSLPFLACLAVPLLGLGMARRGAPVARIFLTLAACHGLIAALVLLAEALLSPSAFQHWPLASTLTSGDAATARSTVSVRITPDFVVLNAAVLALCGALFWGQNRLNAAPYTTFTRWLAAPIACFAATTVPMSFALTYFLGFYDWATARLSDKLFIIATSFGFTLTGFALAVFALQFGVSALRLLTRNRKS